MQRSLLLAYYAATALFVSLDYGFGINIRVAFLEHLPDLRLGYYVVLFACMALMLWRPDWTTLISTIESLATIIALIFGMALRSLVVTEEMLQGEMPFITMYEVINFVIAGGAAYVGWSKGLHALQRRH